MNITIKQTVHYEYKVDVTEEELAEYDNDLEDFLMDNPGRRRCINEFGKPWEVSGLEETV